MKWCHYLQQFPAYPPGRTGLFANQTFQPSLFPTSLSLSSFLCLSYSVFPTSPSSFLFSLSLFISIFPTSLSSCLSLVIFPNSLSHPHFISPCLHLSLSSFPSAYPSLSAVPMLTMTSSFSIRRLFDFGILVVVLGILVLTFSLFRLEYGDMLHYPWRIS